MTAPITVFKLGGSLLDWPEWTVRFCMFLKENRPCCRPLMVVGGGAAANLVRAWEARLRLSSEQCHQLALEAMALNELLTTQLLGFATRVETRAEAELAWNRGTLAVLRASRFLAAEEASQGTGGATSAAIGLPHSWEATSDSIAAWVARRWPADELILLKSVSLSSAAKQEPIVDPCFDSMAEPIPSVFVLNLRAETLELERWRPGAD